MNDENSVSFLARQVLTDIHWVGRHRTLSTDEKIIWIVLACQHALKLVSSDNGFTYQSIRELFGEYPTAPKLEPALFILTRLGFLQLLSLEKGAFQLSLPYLGRLARAWYSSPQDNNRIEKSPVSFLFLLVSRWWKKWRRFQRKWRRHRNRLLNF